MLQNLSFSGHETFPLRFSWLKKAVDAIRADPAIFGSDDAIAIFGVGKNMVRSIRHWGLVSGVLERDTDPIGGSILRVSVAGEYVFGHDGADPYLEDTGTSWLLHWWLCSSPEGATLWHFVFGHWREGALELRNLQPVLKRWLDERGGAMPAASTLHRDLQCLQNTYIAPRSTGSHLEDAAGCPLVSLGLLYENGGIIYLREGRQRGLPPEIFAYAVLDYWDRTFPEIETLSVRDVLTRRASPGQVFLLTQEQAFELVSRIESFDEAPFRFDNTAGLQQFYRTPGAAPQTMLDRYYARILHATV